MSKSASSIKWLARHESIEIRRDRYAIRVDRLYNPQPMGGWYVSPPIKPKTAERRAQDKRKNNANLYAPMLSSKRCKTM